MSDLQQRSGRQGAAGGSEPAGSIAMAERHRCDYRYTNPWQQPLGRLAEFLRPIQLDPQSYVLMRGARLLSPALVGVSRGRRIIPETHHLEELTTRRRCALRLRSLLPARERLSGTVCSLVDGRRWYGSYYHWFLDCLPRLIAADDHGRRSGERPRLIVPDPLNRWQQQSLDLLGIDPGQHLPAPLVGGGGIAVDQLIGYVAHRWQRLDGAPFDAASPWAIRLLADRLSSVVAASTAGGPRRLYLSRRGVPTRQVSNEEAVLALLEPHGFVAVQTETLSLAEQIDLFRGATHIVAPHGASLTNLLHAQEASVLELFQAGHGVRPDFFQLAMINGLDYRHAVCPSNGAAAHCQVDLGWIRDYLDQTL